MIKSSNSSNITFTPRVMVILLVVVSVRLLNAVIPDVEIVTKSIGSPAVVGVDGSRK